MDELTPSDVRALAAALALPLAEVDATEIAHRLNAFVEALAPLASESLLDAEPFPLSPP